MEKYNVVFDPRIGNPTVREINAKVLIKTFPLHYPADYYRADLYESPYSGDTLVYHETCRPINSAFKETVLLNFNQ